MIWAKIDTAPPDTAVLRLPGELAAQARAVARVKCGGVETMATAESASPDGGGDGTFERPLRLLLPGRLLKRLCLPTSPVYRVRVEGNALLIGPVTGLLLGGQTHRYTPEHMRKYSDRLGVYPQLGGLVCAFSPEAVDWQRGTACGLFFNVETGEWEYGCFPLPDVVYRRDFHVNPALVRKLSDRLGGRLFNSCRFTKFELYDFIGTDEKLAPFIPPTEQVFDSEQLMDFIARHPKSILKPVDLSRGRGIAVVEKEAEGGGYLVTDYRTREPVCLPMEDAGALATFFEENPAFFEKYIVQRCLPLANISGMRYDVRVVMQKHPDKSWGCSGIECRVSAPDCHLTNISRGGFALTLHEALRRSFASGWEGIPARIDALCRRFCARMEETGEHFAEFGMDIAVDTDKNLWLIEANVFPSFKGFRATDYPTYLSIRYAPLLYALSLTPFADAPGAQSIAGSPPEGKTEEMAGETAAPPDAVPDETPETTADSRPASPAAPEQNDEGPPDGPEAGKVAAETWLI